MSKLTDIKYRIDQMDGGAFQNLCDAYLSCKGYKNVYSLGMRTGTDKTAKGNPDTYFRTDDNKYIFVMYTTQKTDFLKKAHEDIDKCFETGVAKNDITEIIYCHTYGRLAPSEDQSLINHCKEYGVTLKLIGLDVLGYDIYYKYPILAKDFFNISIDSGQIMPMDIFISRHDANKMSAPLRTDFILREKELETAKETLTDHDVLMIAGPAGVGKTRFALELCQQLQKEKNYNVLVIKSNNLQLHDDLIAALEAGKEYLVLVDDANELTGLNFVLDYLIKVKSRPRHISKLILTVRDYARKKVMNCVTEFVRPAIMKIDKFADDDIKKLLETCYDIKNYIYANRIIAIAEGNARLAMLAGKIVADTHTLSSIRDASDLYHSYYGKQLDMLLKTNTRKYSAGIIAFFNTVHLERLERIQPIFDLAHMSKDDFISDLTFLHKAEIVDMCNNKAARISDESFSNFLIKYLFVEEKLLPLNVMIEIGFKMNSARTIEACNMLLNVFSDKDVIEYINSQIAVVWDKLKNDRNLFPSFFKAFHMIRPTETLLLLKNRIDNEVEHNFAVSSLSFKDIGRNRSISDDVIDILSSFEKNDSLPEALELLLLYYEKRPDLFEQFYIIYTEKFGVGIDSPRFDYYTQRLVVKSLCEAIEENPNDKNLLYLFVYVAKKLLTIDVSKTSFCRRNTLSIFNFSVKPDPPLLEYRKMLFQQLYRLHESGKLQFEIEKVIDGYGKLNCGANIAARSAILKAEFPEIMTFINLFTPENLHHSLVAVHIAEIAKSIDHAIPNELSPFLNSEKYKIYSILKDDGIDESVQITLRRIRAFVENFTTEDLDSLIQVSADCCYYSREGHNYYLPGLSYVFEAFDSKDVRFLYLVDAYMKADTPYEVYPQKIIEKLFEVKSVEEVKAFITKYTYKQQNLWLWFFYTLMPPQEISQYWADDLLKYLKTPNTELTASPYRPIYHLRKYEKVTPKIVTTSLRVILEHYEEYPTIFNQYTFYMLTPSNEQETKKLLGIFENELPLLEELYLKGISCRSNADYEGTLLYAIISIDKSFLCRYLDALINIKNKHTGVDDYYDSRRLVKLWSMEKFSSLADRAFDHLQKNFNDPILWLDDTPLNLMLSNATDDQTIIEKQDIWVQHTIEKYPQDKDRLYKLFSAITEWPDERRRRAVQVFLSINDDPNIFESLPLESLSCSGFGSLIPYMQERIEYLESLLPLVAGVRYLKQKYKIEKDINIWKSRIESAEIRELLESWYR